MTYYALLKRLARMTPQQLRQQVVLEEGASGNVTTVTCVQTARKDEYYEELVPNEGNKKDPDGTTMHWEKTDERKYKKGQIWLLHDHGRYDH